MSLYCGIDLHSNNHLLVLIDKNDSRLIEEKLPNDLSVTLDVLKPFKKRIRDIAIESTFNWYWLVDGLMQHGYPVSLVNTTAVKQYEGLKYSDDRHDAFWLAHLSRLGILPTGFIYPKDWRSVRDLLRRRSQIVKMRAQNILSVQNQIWRSTGFKVRSQSLQQSKIQFDFDDQFVVEGVKANYRLMKNCQREIWHIETLLKEKLSELNSFEHLKSIPGVGVILAATITLETFDISRFERVNDYASYARCVSSNRYSNDKKKGVGNRKNGNKYLSWAFHEAAHHAVRYYPPIKQFYEKKKTKTNGIIAIRAVAHKLARASYWIMKTGELFDMKRAF